MAVFWQDSNEAIGYNVLEPGAEWILPAVGTTQRARVQGGDMTQGWDKDEGYPQTF